MKFYSKPPKTHLIDTIDSFMNCNELIKYRLLFVEGFLKCVSNLIMSLPKSFSKVSDRNLNKDMTTRSFLMKYISFRIDFLNTL